MKKIFALMILTALLAGAGAPAGAATAAGASAAGAAGAGAFKLPARTEHKLPNGLTVFVMETREVPLVTLNLLIPVGSAADAAGEDGVANITGRLLMKGAGGLTADQIAEMIEQVGGDVSVNTGRDYTTITASYVAKDFERAMEILSTIVLRPDFPAAEIDREKSIIAAEIAGVKDNPNAYATREFIRAISGNHPYAHPVSGSEETVGGMTREKVVAFYGANYVPAGAYLAIVGDVNGKKALELAKARFGAWKGAAKPRLVPALEIAKFPGRRVIIIDKSDATQSQIRFGNIAVPYNTPEFFPLTIANSVLGGGFTSRLMNEIRVNRGLTYVARSGLTQLKHGGFFGVYTYTKNKSLRETIDVALDQVRKMRTEKLSEAELQGAKRYITGLFPFDVETNADLANWLTTLSFYGLPVSFVEEYSAKIDAATADECLKAVQNHFWLDDNFVFLMTKYDETKDQLQDLGKIEVVKYEDMK